MTFSWGADVLLIRHKSGSNDNRCYNAKVWLNKYLFFVNASCLCKSLPLVAEKVLTIILQQNPSLLGSNFEPFMF